jgi:hypothetical protein
MADNSEFLAKIRKQFDSDLESEREIRHDFVKDLHFIAGEQWDPAIRANREKGPNPRPCLTINELPEKVQQVVNQGRQNRPAGKVSPVEDADDKTADVIQGIGRHIEYISQASIAYDTAFEYAVSGGFGYLKLITEYVDNKSFDQDIKIQRVKDPLSILFPPCEEIDYSDADHAFETYWLTKDQFEAEYPDDEAVSAEFAASYWKEAPGWFENEKIRLVRYWQRKKIEKTIEGIGKDGKARSRKTYEYEVTAHITNGVKILEREEWAGQCIPIIPVLGKEIYIEGKRYLISAIRHARDPQQLLNYATTAAAEATMLAPKAPFLGATGQFKNSRWQSANAINYAYLEYDPIDVSGKPVGPPQRQIFEPPIQALEMLALRATEQIKSTTGIYDPSLGKQETQQSGRAIGLLKNQSDQANYHLIDNLSRSICAVWRQLIDLIPKVYDTQRQVRILGNDESQKIVTVNGPHIDEESGEQVLYDLQAGRYDVTVEVGPSYNTKRQEASQDMAQFATAVPELVPRYADLYIKAQDWPYKEELAERLCPPEFAKQDGKQTPQQTQQVLSQLMAQHEQLTAALNAANDALQTKDRDNESRERIAAMQEETKRTIALATLNANQGLELLRQEVGAVKHQLEMRHEHEVLEHQGAIDQEQAKITAQQSASQEGAASEGESPASMTGTETGE